jgi:redox-sensitive bicupin YhaK (pirin superfamily)
MKQKITESVMKGGGPIRVLYPGLVTEQMDTGIGSIGRVDHAFFKGNHVVSMHPHVNDEILSYFRSGKTEHRDSEGNIKFIGKNRLMLMKAGKLFYHEERMFDEGEAMEGLQIFIRPGKKDLKPEVLFYDLEEMHSLNKWRVLASPKEASIFQFSSQTWIYDMKLVNSNTTLPAFAQSNLTCLLYVFNGSITVNEDISVAKRESLLIKNESITISSDNEAELVLFITDENAEYFSEGMYSGNQV